MHGSSFEGPVSYVTVCLPEKPHDFQGHLVALSWIIVPHFLDNVVHNLSIKAKPLIHSYREVSVENGNEAAFEVDTYQQTPVVA